MTSAQHKAEARPGGVRGWVREIVFASIVALIAVTGAIQAVAGFEDGNRKAIANGGDILLLAAVITGVWLWGYWAMHSARKLAVERKFSQKVDDMRAEVLAGITETNEGISRLVGPEPRPALRLASVHDLPRR